MTEQLESAQLKHIPTRLWVRFLRTYGPTPNGAAMFDEHVAKAARQAKVDPIQLPLPLLPKMLESIEQQNCGAILIAGTAGDGKTYHARSLWQALGGSTSTWDNGCAVKHLKLKDGRDGYFVKDLSELNESDNNFTFGRLEQAVLTDDRSIVLVVAANHGQILECLRKRHYQDQAVHPLKLHLETVFLQAGEGHPRLQVFDLSRSTHRKSLTDVLDVLTNHPEWEKCNSCQFQKTEAGCPIFENRRRLIDQGEAAQQMHSRMADLIELARLNGSHLPIRDLLALCANILLGHPEAKDGLMRCDDVEKMMASGTTFKASLYDNIVGANLLNRRVTERPIFKALSSFQIGYETTSQIDGLLIYGQHDQGLSSNYQRLIADDAFYGANHHFKMAQDAYLEGDEQRREQASAVFMRLLQSQRRRLFFTLPPEDFSQDYFWHLSSYRYAGLYLVLLQSLQKKAAVADATRQLIVKGINRIMTGMLIDDTNSIFVATSGGFTQSKVSILCKEEIPANTLRSRGKEGMAIRLNDSSKPYLEFRMSADTGEGVTFELTPIRFEFLVRVASGALPNSFSSECAEDLLALKSRLLRRVERLNQELAELDDYVIDDSQVLLDFVNDGDLNRPRHITVGLHP